MKKFLNEFSKIALVTTFSVGIFCVLGYFIGMFIGREMDSQTVKWGMDLIIVPFFGYITYQLGMKNSLNKNGLYIADDGKVKKIQ